MVNGEIETEHAAHRLADIVKTFGSHVVGDGKQVLRQAIYRPVEVGFGNMGLAVAAHIEADEPVGARQRRQPGRPDAPIDADAMVEQDGRRRLQPRRRQIDKIVIDRPRTGRL